MEKQHFYLRPVTLEDVSESEFAQEDMQNIVVEREELRQALANLSADQRRVIALRYGADLTESDIAQVLGWPVGTVKSRLNRTRERLRSVLTRDEKEVGTHGRR